jgi:hypothetical protein
MPIMPIPIYHGHSRPLTEYERKVLLGVFIILLSIWIVSSIYLLFKYYVRKNVSGSFFEYYYDIHCDLNFFVAFLNYMMTFLFVIGVLIWLGSLVSKFL